MPRPLKPATPTFWREASLPFIEARTVPEGRELCYAAHSHSTFSMGAITAGACDYRHESHINRISAGTVVVMNPGEVHACNPVLDEPWSYVMLFVDAAWLASLQQEAGLTTAASFQPFAITHSTDINAYRALMGLHATLTNPALETLQKHCDVITFSRALPRILGLAPEQPVAVNPRVERAAAFLDDNYRLPVSLEDLCQTASLSASHLIRSFQQRYHMTPHAYLINRRVQQARQQLREGGLIAQVAQDCGFADQAHLQRAFKKHLAVTPGEYRSAPRVNAASTRPNTR